MNKHRALQLLAKKRQKSRWPGYKCIGDYKGGKYECDHVSPYSKTAGNVDSQIFVLLQDWSSNDVLRGKLDPDSITHGYGTKVRTNTTLQRLLKEHFGVESLKDIYATNLFPFIKLGNMSADIPPRDLESAALEFARPQIEIVRPRIVICLGLKTFDALRKAYGYDEVHPMSVAIRSPFKVGKSFIFCQAHTGSRGQQNRNQGGVRRVPGDWRWMKKKVGI